MRIIEMNASQNKQINNEKTTGLYPEKKEMNVSQINE